MNNLKMGVYLFILFVVCAIISISLIVVSKSELALISGATTIVIFIIMIRFFLTHDPRENMGGWK